MNARILILATMMMLAAVAGHAQMDGAGPMGFSFDPFVAPDGTILTLRSDADQQHGSDPMSDRGMELIAVDLSGVIAWTFETGGGVHDLTVVNDMVIIAVTDGGGMGWWDGVNEERSSRIVALTLAAGTVVWDVELDEVVRSLESTSDRIYAVSGTHGQQQSGTTGRAVRRPGHGHGQGPGTGPADGTGERTLFALGLDGSLLWTLSLN